MFGLTMHIINGSYPVKLRALRKEDLPTLVEHFSSMKIHLFTKGLFAQTLENETEWYEKRRKSEDDVAWCIVPLTNNGEDIPIGITSLHRLSARDNSSASGIIIWDSNWWGKGIASNCHLGRTLFAADYLNRWKINSSVRVENVASRRALEKVGYTVWGTEPCSTRRSGKWLSTHYLLWLHPDMQPFLFPEGTPSLYEAGIERAQLALEKARNVVEFP